MKHVLIQTFNQGYGPYPVKYHTEPCLPRIEHDPYELARRRALYSYSQYMFKLQRIYL